MMAFSLCLVSRHWYPNGCMLCSYSCKFFSLHMSFCPILKCTESNPCWSICRESTSSWLPWFSDLYISGCRLKLSRRVPSKCLCELNWTWNGFYCNLLGLLPISQKWANVQIVSILCDQNQYLHVCVTWFIYFRFCQVWSSWVSIIGSSGLTGLLENGLTVAVMLSDLKKL